MKLNPDKAYAGSSLLLPIKKINLGAIKNSLEFKSGSKKIKLYKEGKHHIEVPRYYLSPKEYESYDFEVEILERKVFPAVDIRSNIELWDKQLEPFDKLSESEDGILNLITGKGKTVLALHDLAIRSTPTLIIVHNEYLRNQWIKFIEEFLEVEGIGSINGSTFNWQYPICIATIQTLVNRVRNDEIPQEFKDWFGRVIYDEGHHLGAAEFVSTANVCEGSRLLLTATLERIDGMERFIKYYIGDVLYEDKEYDLKPNITFLETKVDEVYGDDEHYAVVTSNIASSESCLDSRENEIKKYLGIGRKIICISSRLNQLEELNKRLGGALVIGGDDLEQGIELIKKSELSFVIDKLGIEGLDVKELDTLFLLLPIGGSKKIGMDGSTKFLGSNLKQVIGRILRKAPKKKEPLVFIFDDVNIYPLHKLCEQAKFFLERENFEFKTQSID